MAWNCRAGRSAGSAAWLSLLRPAALRPAVAVERAELGDQGRGEPRIVDVVRHADELPARRLPHGRSSALEQRRIGGGI